MNQGPYNPYDAPAPPGHGGPPGYGAPGYGATPYGAHGGGYEFDAQQNAVIGQAAFWARLLGIFLIITGAVALLNCNVISFAVNLAIGISFLGGATALTAVVNTQGNDIAHMMTALTKLGTAFKIRVIVTLVAVALVAVIAALVGVLLVGAAAGS